MAANNTPMPDLIELSSINANATFTAAPGGGGDILGVVDNATYTDSDSSNSPTQLVELIETSGGDGGTITIDGTEYNIRWQCPTVRVTMSQSPMTMVDRRRSFG